MLKKSSLSLSILVLTALSSVSAAARQRQMPVSQEMSHRIKEAEKAHAQSNAQALSTEKEKPESEEEAETYAFPVRMITSLSELERILKARKPSIVVFNSPVCGACVRMKPGLEKAAKKYDSVTFAVFSVTPEIKKNVLTLLEKNNMPKYDSYPATYFIKEGTKPRFEGGAMESDEMDRIVHLFAYGKPRPHVMPSKQAVKK